MIDALGTEQNGGVEKDNAVGRDRVWRKDPFLGAGLDPADEQLAVLLPPEVRSGAFFSLLTGSCMKFSKLADFGNRFGTGLRVMYNLLILLVIQKYGAY